MLITNGIVSRDIDARRYAEYASKGYTEVKATEAKKPAEKGKKTAEK